MAQECIAKSKAGTLEVTMKEKYGLSCIYKGLTVIMLHDGKFYLNDRTGHVAILPACNWSIVGLDNPKPDEEE